MSRRAPASGFTRSQEIEESPERVASEDGEIVEVSGRRELRCRACGYGAIVERAPSRCPIGGSRRWKVVRSATGRGADEGRARAMETKDRFEAGDEIVAVGSGHAPGGRNGAGVVLEVLGHAPDEFYRVLWANRSETIFRPGREAVVRRSTSQARLARHTRTV